ncbi:Uma2 family endonuclease [Scytonema sp. UIC 10036]|uniref:Uma2 family endonuclease n=1 Tax=Scytonema sp. UIC 10036 TaxID=2304196 RepID=UPI0012DA8A75|nr:Uma2 family endonuclease [Scytonema sp. UIC 10036]MUG91873.1 Uma2 family endonuclease [Scytonema sp. UIC 10036]
MFAWVEPRQLGYVLGSQVGYQLTNGEILQPHCSFVSRQKLKRMPRTYPEVPPDLIMEIKSAFDRLLSVQKKVQSFLKWGTRIGILIEPDRHTVSVYRPDTTVTILEEGETLVLPELLPDWELPVSELWTPSLN